MKSKKLQGLVLTFCFPFIAFAQNEFSASFSMSSLGQTNNLINDFYYLGHESGFQDDAHTGNDHESKYNLTLGWGKSDSQLVSRLRIGFGNMSNQYTQTFLNTFWEVNDAQKLFEIAPSVGYFEDLGRFRFTAGLEVPLYFIGEFEQTIAYKTFQDDGTIASSSIQTTTMDGGYIIGLNGFLNLSLKAYSWLSIFTEVNYGWLYADLGGKLQSSTEMLLGPPNIGPFEIDKTYQKTFFSDPSFQFGITCHF